MYSLDNMFDCPKIPLSDIKSATNDFCDEHKIETGGHGRLYKGELMLKSGKTIDIAARRRLLDGPRSTAEGTKACLTEIKMLSSLRHQNVASIVGFCDEDGELIVVIKYEARKSLDRYLSDPTLIPWTQRLKICLGIARAISYIHFEEGRSFSVIHRDIRSSHILVDDNWEPKLTGFGTSMMHPAATRHRLVLDDAVGVFGYADPAYIRSASVSHKSDVYGFGVVLFELLTGKNALRGENVYIKQIETKETLALLATSHYENGKLNDIIHPGLLMQMKSQSLKVFTEAGYRCLQDQRSKRPNIDQVIFQLEQALELQLASQNLEQSAAWVDQSTLTGYWKGKNLDHLKIGYDAIKLATKNFSKEYLIGKGGFGAVYKAELEHYDSFDVESDKKLDQRRRRRSIVAIKNIYTRLDSQGEEGFNIEIETLSSCKHPNIVHLLGFCDEQHNMILVYEHVPNGSLEDYLENREKMSNLTWVQRLKICIDIACGLDYLHTPTDDKQKIYHLDIKSANVLLGENLEAKIADFGLSRFHPLNKKSTIITKKLVGTQVYLDPEYQSTGRLKTESDVYSFGVVLFEILTGRLAYDPVYTEVNEMGLATVVRQHFENGTLMKLIDPCILEERDEDTFIPSKGPNEDSLHTFLKIGYECLAKKQAQRPTLEAIIDKLQNALNFQVSHKDSFRISLEDIKLATKNFEKQIGMGGFGNVFRGDVSRVSGPTPIAVKRHTDKYSQGEKEFLTELEILVEYKHENIIGVVGYCDESDEMMLVYEYAGNGSLDRHLKDASLGWTERLKIGIDVAKGLEFLHGVDSSSTQAAAVVIHRDIKSGNVLLDDDWKAKITDFGLSIITPINNKTDFAIDDACGTYGYVDPVSLKSGLLTRESDIYSFGVVLSEMMCGRLAFHHIDGFLIPLVKRGYEEGTLDELVFEGIKDKITPKSLAIYQRIMCQCLHDERQGRPTASEVIKQLNKALEFQEDIEIWEAKLPRDYREIIQMSKTPDNYSNLTNKDLYEMFSKGILLRNGNVLFSVGSNGERNEMHSYGKNRLHKLTTFQNSRFQRVTKIMNIEDLNIQIKIKTLFLSENVIYGAHLVFKFCDPRKVSNKLMYVNLTYRLGSETMHAFFAKRGDDDDEWMTIELCRFKPHKKDVKFEVLLHSLSRYYCGNGAIFVEGIHFRDATLEMQDEKLKGVERSKLSSDFMQQVSVDYHEITQLADDVEKLSSLSIANYGNKYHMLPAKMILYDSSNFKCFNWNWKSLPQSGFLEVAELLPQQLFYIKCMIETQNLTPDTYYGCHLVFKLSERCHGLQCPVKVKDVRGKKSRDSNLVYFRSPRLVNFHGNEKVPKHREDGLTEIIVWEFNSGNNLSDDHLPISLKLRCYEGTMCGLVVYGIDIRPI